MTGIFATLAGCNTPNVAWISVSPENTWKTSTIRYDQISVDSAIIVDTLQQAQRIDGFGGCFNEMGWKALLSIDSAEREELLSDFFEPGNGFNFSICRMPIGANDYSFNWYSLNDSAGDYEMKYFNIDRDKKTLVPYIRRAQHYNPSLKIWGSPWCPPTWMKTNNHYACASNSFNTLDTTKQGAEGVTQFIMKPEYLTAYANYFSHFITEYGKIGIPIYAVHIQNEFNSCQVFPSCTWRVSDLTHFVGRYLGPTLSNTHPEVDLWFGTIERPYIENIDTMLADSLAAKYIKGLGFQWAGKGAIVEANIKYPGIDKMQTESECGDGSNDWKAARHTWLLIEHYLRNGANAYIYWNLALEKDGVSYWGWKQNSLVSIDTLTGSATRNPEYWIFRLLCSHVKPGATHIRLNETAHALAFKNPDGTVVVLTSNPGSGMVTKKIKLGSQTIQAQLSPGSYHAFIFPVQND